MAKKHTVKNQAITEQLKAVPSISDCDDPATLEMFISLLKRLLAEAAERLRKLRQ